MKKSAKRFLPLCILVVFIPLTIILFLIQGWKPVPETSLFDVTLGSLALTGLLTGITIMVLLATPIDRAFTALARWDHKRIHDKCVRQLVREYQKVILIGYPAKKD